MYKLLCKSPVLRKNGRLPNPPPYAICISDVLDVQELKDCFISVWLAKKIEVIDRPI
jgi:hypothetical protein